MLRRISSIFSPSGSKTTRSVDSTFDYPSKLELAGGNKIARKLSNELRLGNWHVVHAFLEKEATPLERYFFLDAVTSSASPATGHGAIQDRPGWVDDWAAAFPDSPISWLMRGFFGKNWAWDLKLNCKDKDLDETTRKIFHSRLQVAEKDLMKAIEIDPKNANAWAMLIWTGIGLEVLLDTIQERLGAVMEQEPNHRAAYSAALQSLTVKHGGSKSHDLMFAFARKLATESPEGSSLHTLICEAHCECYAAIESPEEQDDYFKQHAVLSEIMAAAENSVLSDRYVENIYSVRDRNFFAFCLAQSHAYDLALTQFETLGPQITRMPWVYFDEPLEAYSNIYDGCVMNSKKK